MLKRSFFTVVYPVNSASRLGLSCFIFFAIFSTSFAQTPNTASKPQLVPNARRYKESGLKPPTGRSGSASVTGRALLGKDGTTTVELTTGQLDTDDTKPGSINKSQIKPLDENGEALYARNYTNSGGYFSTTVNDLHRGQQVQMQATINGIDAYRTNVVTVVETVKLRPDLSPTNLSVPARGVPGNPVNISVVLRELRGDSGATTNLILYADGTAVDRANGVWVDAAGTVSCVFTHTFNSAGTKQLEVKAEQTAPGDYDLSNNALTGTIVIGPVTNAELNYNVQVIDGDDDYRAHTYEKLYFNGVLQTEREEDFSAKGWQQQANFFGWTARMVSFPLNLSHQETNDGAMVFSDAYTDLTPTSVIDDSNGVTRFIAYNVSRFESSTGHYFNLSTTATINLATGARTELTSFSSNRQAGDVTYHSAGYERFWDGTSGEEFFYTWNTTDVVRAGTRLPLGTHYGINISLTTGDGTVYSASPNVTMQPFDNSGQQPFMCFDWSFDEFSGTSCIQNERVWIGKHGFAFKDTAWVPQVVIQ